MKSILLILLINLSSHNTDLSTIRELYLGAHTSKSNCIYFGKKLTSIKDNSSILINGYKGCYFFIKCKFINSPIKKIISFNKGKKLLESAIKLDPQSVELRFLRYSIQINSPRFLFYYDNIKKDLNFVINNVENIKNKKTQKFITKSLKSINKLQ